MGFRPAAVAAGVAALLLAAGASAGTAKQDAALATKLRPQIKAKFAKDAPALVLGKVTCDLASSGKSATCHAHLTDAAAKADIVYVVSARRSVKAGRVTWTWTAHSPSCSSETTHATLSCG